MIVGLDYGNKKLKVKINDKNLLYIAAGKQVKPVKNPESDLQRSIEDPIGSISLKERIKNKKKNLHSNIGFHKSCSYEINFKSAS